MIFTGDIAQPYTGASDFYKPENIKAGLWVGNLEGSVIKNATARGVYNAEVAIARLCEVFPFKVLGIANNHLLDSASAELTKRNMQNTNIPLVGGGILRDASKPVIVIDEDKIAYRVLAFGWENIQCVPATESREGVNPYTRFHVIQSVKDALTGSEKVICFFHWNYELEKYPQPYDRHFAHDLIDLGVAAVIGCHAHRVQPIEFYKGKPIVYGLGNFLFCQGHYFDGKLRFPKFCEDEYAFEINKEGYKLHYFHYDSQENRLEYVKSAVVNPDVDFEGKAVFTSFSDKEYEKWFKKNRVQKKLLPIFYTNESPLSYWMKSRWINVRGELINLLTIMNIKSRNRANR